MNIDLGAVTIEAVESGDSAFRKSLDDVLSRVAPLTAVSPGLAPEERIQRLGSAINIALDLLEELTGTADSQRLPALIERISDLAVTGDKVEVHIGVAGDLYVSKDDRLIVDGILASCKNIPLSTRPAAYRNGVAALQRLLALLLLHGWANSLHGDEKAQQEGRQAIIETVQGHG